jgi:hypothetical protein
MPKQFSKQETFDIVARALAAQGRPSRQEGPDSPAGGRCAYRGDGGTKCAAGWLIPDDVYSPDMEGHFATSPEIADVLAAEGHDYHLAEDLQDAHDAASAENRATGQPWLPGWADRMRRLAGRQGLSTAVLYEALAARAGGEAVSS